MSEIRFDGKTAVVTGAGGGLGRCHALELARRGANVVVNDLGGSVDGSGGSSEAAEKVVAEIKEMGGNAIANGSSVTDDAGVENLVKQTNDAFGTAHDDQTGTDGGSGLTQRRKQTDAAGRRGAFAGLFCHRG